MIRLRIKIRSEASTFSHLEFLPDDYVVSKNNENLKALVKKACDNSHFETIEDVKVTASFEW
jgi:hypothetical protein